MSSVVPLASGKGGVGKTVLTSNLGIALAKAGQRVILVDLDLGGSNLHTCLGLKNTHAGLGGFIAGKEKSLAALVQETGQSGLKFISGDALIPGTANLPFFMKQRIIKELPLLDADIVLADLGAGTSYNVVDFFLTNLCGLIVTTPETTSILNAYSFLKTALYRLLIRSFPSRSREREFLQDFLGRKTEGTGLNFSDMMEGLGSISAASAKTGEDRIKSFHPRVVLNMGKSATDIPLGGKLRQIVRKNTGMELTYIGFVPYDESVQRSIFERTSAYQLSPGSAFSRSMDALAAKLAASPAVSSASLYEGDEDLDSLSREDWISGTPG